MSPTPFPAPAPRGHDRAEDEAPVVEPVLTLVPSFDLDAILTSIDTMAAQRPVAAQIVSVANSDETSAKALARILATDLALAGRVMKLANSAYFGMRGRVTSLQFAVTVVGFTTVRTMATVALSDLDDESKLPDNFWHVTTTLALTASALAPRFGERPQDALCIGLLAQMGAALLHHNDPDGYAELVAENPSFTGRRAAEVRRYGISAVRLTSVALEMWGFPHSMVVPMQRIDDPNSAEGGLLRACYEATARLTVSDYEPQPIGPMTCGRLRDEDLPPVLYQVRFDADEMRSAMFG
jgi:HD-like signal output (HDOD) protein